jgi:hypothetical protein
MTRSRREFLTDATKAIAGSKLLTHGAQSWGDSSESMSGGRRRLQAFDYEGVQLNGGMLKEQLQRTRAFYLGIPDDDILKGFRKRAGLNAPGDDMGGWCEHDTAVVFGQWLSGMARLSKACDDADLKKKSIELMKAWAIAFAKDGKPYASKTPKASHYLFDKTLCGLVDMHHYLGETDSRSLLERLTEWGATNLNRSRIPASATDPSAPVFEGVEWYTLSENLYRAFEYIGDPRYRDFGDLWRYPQYWNKFTAPGPIDIHGVHAYSHVNTLSSAAMAYAITGSPEYLRAIVAAYDHFQRVQTFATGGYGPGEQLVADDGTLGRSLEVEGNTFETPCGTWAVFKLCRYLIEFTGEARYGDWMEKLLYNGIGAALPMADRTNPFFNDIWSKHGWNAGIQVAERGKTFYYADYRLGAARKDYYYAGWPCCSGTYIQDVADYHNLIYFKSADCLCVNLFIPSTVTWNFAGNRVQCNQQTDYPESEKVLLTVDPQRSAEFVIKLRIPGWAKGVAIKINDHQFPASIRPGHWAEIRRQWTAGDRIECTIFSELKIVPIDRQHPRRVAMMVGPVVLVQDENPILSAPEANLAPDLKPLGRPLEFAATQGQFPRVRPFYGVDFGSPYSMYFDVV